VSFEDVLPRARRETTQIHRVIIAAPAARIWAAITDPEWTVRYGFGGGYPFMLSDLKSLLETGRSLPASRPTRKS